MRRKDVNSMIRSLIQTATLILASFSMPSLVTAANPPPPTECNLLVWIEGDDELWVACPDVPCETGGSGDCILEIKFAPPATRSAKCKCSGGGQEECNTQVSVTSGVATVTCLNPCAASCDAIPAITGTPQVPCFCDN